METIVTRVKSLREFLSDYTKALKNSAPVNTGRLRDSITIPFPTLAQQLKIDVMAVNYAIYANNKHHFVEKNDPMLDDFATNFASAMWEDFFNDNKTPNNKIS